MVWHGLDHKSNFEPVLPLKIFGIGAFLSNFLEKKQRKLDLTHFQEDIQPMQGAKMTSQIGLITDPNLKKVKIDVFRELRKYCPDKNHSQIL